MFPTKDKVIQHDKDIAVLYARQDTIAHSLESIDREVQGLYKEFQESRVQSARDRTKMLWAALAAGFGAVVSTVPWVIEHLNFVS